MINSFSKNLALENTLHVKAPCVIEHAKGHTDIQRVILTATILPTANNVIDWTDEWTNK